MELEAQFHINCIGITVVELFSTANIVTMFSFPPNIAYSSQTQYLPGSIILDDAVAFAHPSTPVRPVPPVYGYDPKYEDDVEAPAI